MFPLNDFNFVCCALATFSAAVGYGVSKRRSERRRSGSRTPAEASKDRRHSFTSILSSDTSTTLDGDLNESSISDITEPGTLKRKNRDEDSDNYAAEVQPSADPLKSSSPPRKRCRTPPAEELVAEEMVSAEEVKPAVEAAATPSQPCAESEDIQSTTSASTHVSSRDLPTITAAPTHDIGSQGVELPAPAPLPSYSIQACKPSAAFTAFAGSSSGFSLAVKSPLGPTDSIWRSGTREALNNSTDNVSSTTPDDTPNEEPRKAALHQDPLAAHTPNQSTHIAITGEEQEDIESELKGVKLFIKRGDKEFSDGMLGHIKLLVHHETKDDRIVFRREPVWKVSMSVRLRPTVRCAFDEEQGILRITLKEAVEQDGVPLETCPQQVVVYALKRGKASKADFASFARSVTRSQRLLSPPPPSGEKAAV